MFSRTFSELFMSMFVIDGDGVIVGIGDRPHSSVMCFSKQKLTVGFVDFGVDRWQLGLSEFPNRDF